MTGLTETLADGAIAGDALTIGITTSASDSAVASDSVTYVLVYGGNPTDSGVAHDSVSATLHRNFSVSDSAKASDSVNYAGSLTISDTGVAHDSVTFTRTVRINDSARASDSVTTSFKFQVNVADSARASEAWTSQKVILAGDTGSAQDSVSVTIMRNMAVSDSAHASDSVLGVRRLNVSIKDQALAQDVVAFQMSYVVLVQDHAWAQDEIFVPGSVTAFVINSRTNAVTQYSNTIFNSAFSVNRKYVIATDEGLFELNGPTDEGNVNVIANIQGGYFAANGNKYSGLKGVYLKVKGQGGNSTPNWLLNLHTGDGSDYIYEAPSNPGLMTTKFRVGKGIKASEIGWGIINADGQDFDFDNIEFVPAMSGRRVG